MDGDLDEDSERNSVAQVGDRKTRTLIGLALGACIIAGLALASSTVDGGLHLKFASAPTSLRNTQREESRELVDSLLKQVEALKGEIQQLLEQQQQPPAHAITSIEAHQETRNRVSSVYWYSDPAALLVRIESRPEPWGIVPIPPRPANPANTRPTLR
jgi:hypothetical protein